MSNIAHFVLAKNLYFLFLKRRFRITYRLILREKELHFHIGVYNPSKDLTFSFNLLLHTYLKVPDVRRCQITGLHGCTFIDKTRDGPIYQEGRDVVTINEWTDRIYQHTPQEHIITNVVSGRKMRLQKYNFPDTGLIFEVLIENNNNFFKVKLSFPYYIDRVIELSILIYRTNRWVCSGAL